MRRSESYYLSPAPGFYRAMLYHISQLEQHLASVRVPLWMLC